MQNCKQDTSADPLLRVTPHHLRIWSAGMTRFVTNVNYSAAS